MHQLGYSAPARALLVLLLIVGLMMIIWLGQDIIVKFMSVLVFYFVVVLVFVVLFNTALERRNITCAAGTAASCQRVPT